ncbi:HD domain-containing phosphohydrolase [Treponema sp.]|uniref:HD domain-containing phosphohydrolase n=1 Tax=Treponema sp. TaxID=166 RepID=UPI0025EB2C27|nr:HD domain-containing phosphohydrolase [Treponema sp.]MCR5217215.1 HD domain-containing protein [Treponema sp.]
MNRYKNSQIVFITAFSILANIFLLNIARYLSLPLWLDTLGTFFAAYALGPFCGAFIGFSTNIILSFSIPLLIPYSMIGIIAGLITGHMAKHGMMKNMFNTMTLAVLVTIISVAISSVLAFIVRNGSTGNLWGDGIIALLESMGVNKILAVVTGSFYVEFLDKMLSLVILYEFLKLYRNIKSLIPDFFKIQNKITDEEKTKHGPLLKSLLLIFTTGLTLSSYKASAQNVNYNSYVRTIYNNYNGLPGGVANDIAATNDGILWIGTYAGLYRHNGREFRLMDDYPEIKSVRCLYVDDEGRLFTGTNDSGLSIIINESVTNTLQEKDGLPSDSVRCIVRSSDGYYYVGTSRETVVLSISDGLKIKTIFSDLCEGRRIAADSKDHVALVTSDGRLSILKNAEVLYSFKEEEDFFTAVNFSENGILYAATGSGILKSYSLLENGRLKKLNELNCKNLRHINSIDFYDSNIILCSDTGAGYIKDETYFTIETSSFNNSIEHMIEDYQGNLWFSSSRLGILKLCRSSFTEVYLSAGFDEAVVNTITKFNGDLYFGTDKGLSVIPQSGSQTNNQSGKNSLTEYLEGTRVRCLYPDSKGNLWICTKGKGLICADKNLKIKSYESNETMRVVTELSDGSIVAGSSRGIIFLEDNKITGRLTQADGLENPTILTLSQAANGTILAGTDGGGLAIINDKKIFRVIKKSNGLSSNVILRTVNDVKNGRLTGGTFIVTSSGLCYTESSLNFSVKKLSNFPYFNNYDLVINNDSNIFVLGSAGIFVVNREELLSGQKVDYELLDLKKGLRSSLTANSWNYMDEDKNLYLSCDSGASCINLDDYDKHDRSYRIQLKSILIDGKRHIVQKDIPFVIPSDAVNLEIFPEIINYSINNPYIKLYLEGADSKALITLQSSMSGISYSDLKAGSYKFHISLLDSKGKNVTEEAVYEIKKTYRIYDNWWFLLYAGIVLILAVAWVSWFLTITLVHRRIQIQTRELEAVKKEVQMGNETIFSIANAVEARDKSTGRHSYRVAEYAVKISQELGFTQEEQEELRKTGLLHDIGKIGVPDSILNKPSPLTDEEYKIMKKHVDIGGEILRDFTLIKNVSYGAKYHHEHYDGSGYSEGLKGEEIPLNARIIGIADAFDAMTANRVYRKALDMEKVKEELRKNSGTQFDPELTKIMLELIENGKINVHSVIEASAEPLNDKGEQ